MKILKIISIYSQMKKFVILSNTVHIIIPLSRMNILSPQAFSFGGTVYSVHKRKVSTYHAIYREKLVSTFQSPMTICYTSRNNARYVDRWVLLLPSHYIEAKPFISLWQFYYSGMSMTFTGSKSSDCGFGSCWGPNILKFKLLDEYQWKKPLFFYLVQTDVCV